MRFRPMLAALPAAMFAMPASSTHAQPTLTPYKLSVSKSGSGSGTVTSSAGAINCGSNCANSYSPGVRVTLRASAGTGVFTGWSGDCSGTGSCELVMKKDVNVTARFELPKVSISKQGTARSIQVVSTPAGIDCGGVCGANFPLGTSLRLNTAGIPENVFMAFAAQNSTGYDQMGLNVSAVFYEVQVRPESTTVVTAGGGNAGEVTVRGESRRCSWGAGQQVTCSWQLTKGRAYSLDSSVPLVFSYPGAPNTCANSRSCQFTVPRTGPIGIRVR